MILIMLVLVYFFNWDVSADIGKKPDDKFDYSKVFQDGGKYVDKNGHIHGGSLSNYDDEDLNKMEYKW